MIEQDLLLWNMLNKYITMYVSLAGKTDISGYCPAQFDNLLYPK